MAWEDEEHDEESRSARKRGAEALQALGERLIELPNERLAQIPLPDNLAEAIALARRIKKDRGALRRQRQYIGRLMRAVDVEPILAVLAGFDAKDTGRTEAHHRAEHWRDRLLSEGEAAVTGLLSECPEMDEQQLRRLISEAERESRDNRPPRAFRALFRFLRESLGT